MRKCLLMEELVTPEASRSLVQQSMHYFGRYVKRCFYLVVQLISAGRGDIIYAWVTHSIPNLIKNAIDHLQRKVDSKELDSLLDVPSED